MVRHSSSKRISTTSYSTTLRRRLCFHEVTHSLADERAAHRRLHGYARKLQVGFVLAYQCVLFLFLAFLFDQHDGRSEDNGVTDAAGRVNDACLCEFGLQFGDTGFDESLPFLRGIIFGILTQVAVGTSFGDRFDHFGPFFFPQAAEFRRERFISFPRNRCRGHCIPPRVVRKLPCSPPTRRSMRTGMHDEKQL